MLKLSTMKDQKVSILCVENNFNAAIYFCKHRRAPVWMHIETVPFIPLIMAGNLYQVVLNVLQMYMYGRRLCSIFLLKLPPILYFVI